MVTNSTCNNGCMFSSQAILQKYNILYNKQLKNSSQLCFEKCNPILYIRAHFMAIWCGALDLPSVGSAGPEGAGAAPWTCKECSIVRICDST